MKEVKWILPVIVISQFCCTSLWFAGNGVMNDLASSFHLNRNALGHLTSAVQLGFIAGTLVFAVLTIADRFSPSRVFFISAMVGAFFNLGTILQDNGFVSLLGFRFMTGFFLAGIYPVGMKIAADYYQKGLGKSLGFLVGALVVGTAFPHLIKGFSGELPWRLVLILTSSIAAFGGLLMLIIVPDGPYRRSSQKLDLSTSYKVFRNQHFRSAAFGIKVQHPDFVLSDHWSWRVSLCGRRVYIAKPWHKENCFIGFVHVLCMLSIVSVCFYN